VTEEAGGLLWYNPFIAVPAVGQATARMACEIPSDVNLRNVVSHAHSRLSDYTARLWDGPPTRGGRVQEQLYRSTRSPPTGPVSTPGARARMSWELGPPSAAIIRTRSGVTSLRATKPRTKCAC
jgi:hypothetical protein